MGALKRVPLREMLQGMFKTYRFRLMGRSNRKWALVSVFVGLIVTERVNIVSSGIGVACTRCMDKNSKDTRVFSPC